MELLYAYFAGAIDADGWITIQRSTPSATRKDGRRSTYYTAKIGLQQSNPTIPHLLHETFGGYLHMHIPKNPAHRPWHQWSASNQLASKVLTAILPHLRLKRRQAELVLAFNEHVTATPRGFTLSPEAIAERERLWLEVTRLNEPRNRRIHPVTPTTLSTIPPLPSGY